MGFVNWENLPKTQTDQKKIEQMISEYTARHAYDYMAHLGADYSLGAHRIASVLDHAFQSVRNVKIQEYSRQYTYIVDQSGDYDFDNIQDACDAVAALGKGSILVKAGTYDISTSILVPKNCELVGEDRETTILNNVGELEIFYIVGEIDSFKRNVRIHNFTFTGTGEISSAVLAKWCRKVYVYDNNFLSYELSAVALLNVRQCAVYSNYFYNCWVGISTTYADVTFIFDNYIDCNNNPVGISLGMWQGVPFVFNNTIVNPEWLGIYSYDYIDGAIIIGNLISSTHGGGIRLTTGYPLIVALNTVIGEGLDGDTGDPGIFARTADPDEVTEIPDKGVIFGNIVKDINDHGIKISLNRSVVACNAVFGNHDDGLNLSNESYYNLTYSNNLSDNGAYDYADYGTDNMKLDNINPTHNP